MYASDVAHQVHSQPQSDDVELLQAYAAVEKQFRKIAEDVHLPQLDLLVFTKYYIQVKSPQRLEHLKIITKALENHRQSTLRLLKLIAERELVVRSIRDKADLFTAKRMTTLEAQTTVLQLLYQHQQVTLKIVEGIFAWREALTRPFPFQYNGMNYFRKIVADCNLIDNSALKTVLPLRVASFPLCSNISALKLFGAPAQPQAGGPSGVRRAQHKSEWQSSSGPSSGTATPTKRGTKPNTSQSPRSAPSPQMSAASGGHADPILTQRLRAAESLLFTEPQAQVQLMKELMHIAVDRKSFVTLLLLPDVVPNCSTGIPITDARWESQLRAWVAGALHRAESELDIETIGGVSPTQRPAQHDSDSEDDDAYDNCVPHTERDSSYKSDSQAAPPPPPAAAPQKATTAGRPSEADEASPRRELSPSAASTPSRSSSASSLSSSVAASPQSTVASPEKASDANHESHQAELPQLPSPRKSLEEGMQEASGGSHTPPAAVAAAPTPPSALDAGGSKYDDAFEEDD